MKSITKIFGIGIIALIAIVCVGAASAAEVQVGAQLTPTVAPHTYEKGILTIPISNGELAGRTPDFTTSAPESTATPDRDDCGSLNDLPGLEGIGAWTPEHPEPTIVIKGEGNSISTQDVTGYFHNGDFPRWFSDAFPFGDN